MTVNLGSLPIGFQLLLMALVFVSAVLSVLWLSRYIDRRLVRHRLTSLVEPRPMPRVISVPTVGKSPLWVESLYKLSLPNEDSSDSDGRLRFLRAGYRQQQAPKIFFSIKSFLVLLPPLLVWVLIGAAGSDLQASQRTLLALLTAALGYYAPDIYLNWRTKTRRQIMQRGLPDFVDLLVVALESGMGMDQAMMRVAKEMARSNPLLAEEFYIAGLEVRAGVARSTAMRHLAQRVNIEDLDALVTMFNQSERFGTRLGEALRTQSEVIRVKRGQRAEEIAAKIPIKMLFPLILFIFPSVMIVLIGPAGMQIAAAFRLSP